MVLSILLNSVVGEEDILGGFWRLFLVVDSKIETFQFLRVGGLVHLLLSLPWWSGDDPSSPSYNSAHFVEVWRATIATIFSRFDN